MITAYSYDANTRTILVPNHDTRDEDCGDDYVTAVLPCGKVVVFDLYGHNECVPGAKFTLVPASSTLAEDPTLIGLKVGLA
jgi:hypothetical protein